MEFRGSTLRSPEGSSSPHMAPATIRAWHQLKHPASERDTKFSPDNNRGLF